MIDFSLLDSLIPYPFLSERERKRKRSPPVEQGGCYGKTIEIPTNQTNRIECGGR